MSLTECRRLPIDMAEPGKWDMLVKGSRVFKQFSVNMSSYPLDSQRLFNTTLRFCMAKSTSCPQTSRIEECRLSSGNRHSFIISGSDG